MNVYDFYLGLPFGAIWGNLASSAICLGLGYLAALRRFNCATKGCLRFGTQKVPGTTYRTCHHHTTAAHHRLLREIHAAERPAQHDYLNTRDQ